MKSARSTRVQGGQVRIPRGGVLALALMVACALSLARPAGAAPLTYLVNTTADTHRDPARPAGQGTDGNVSLRSAVEWAVVLGGTKSIGLPAGTYDLTLGPLAVTGAGVSLSIEGQGSAANTIIRQDGAHRVFEVGPGAVTFALSAATVTNGGVPAAAPGGGGGILCGGISSSTTLTGCVVAANSAVRGGTGGDGGGIALGGGGSLTLRHCTLRDNVADGNGGGVCYLRQGFGGTLTIFECTFSNNTANSTSTGGGGLFCNTNASAAVVSHTRFLDNTVAAGMKGGAVYNTTGILTLHNCTLSGNTTPELFQATNPPAPDVLVFSVQPRSTTAGVPLSPAPAVKAFDPFGNALSDFAGPVTVSLGANPGGATLSGTLTRNAVAGVATFNNLTLDKAAPTQYTLVAVAPGFTPVTSASFSIRAGAPHHLGFLTQPRTTRYNVAISPAVRVGIQDRFNNLVTTAPGTITLAISTNPAGGTLSGTLSRATASGVASFADLSINRAGVGYRLRATAAGLIAATSAPFDITPGPPAALVFALQPTSRAAGQAIPVKVALVDAAGNVCTSARNSVVISIGTNPAGGVLSGTRLVAAVAGVATFSDLSINKASSSAYTLKAVSGTLPAVESRGFFIIAAAPAKLAFTVQPRRTAVGAVMSPAVRVTILDAFGNTCSRATNTITLSLQAGPAGGHLLGTLTRAATAGSALFNDLRVDTRGDGYVLKASSPGLTEAVSVPFSGA